MLYEALASLYAAFPQTSSCANIQVGERRYADPRTGSLGGDRQPAWENRAHFFGAAAEAMRRILIDRARKKKTVRHGSGFDRIDDIELDQLPVSKDPDQLLAISEALDKLAQKEPQAAEVVKLHCFVGMTHPEIAEVLHVSDRTIKRYWSYAVAWLQRELETDVPFAS